MCTTDDSTAVHTSSMPLVIPRSCAEIKSSAAAPRQSPAVSSVTCDCSSSGVTQPSLVSACPGTDAAPSTRHHHHHHITRLIMAQHRTTNSN